MFIWLSFLIMRISAAAYIQSLLPPSAHLPPQSFNGYPYMLCDLLYPSLSKMVLYILQCLICKSPMVLVLTFLGAVYCLISHKGFPAVFTILLYHHSPFIFVTRCASPIAFAYPSSSSVHGNANGIKHSWCIALYFARVSFGHTR